MNNKKKAFVDEFIRQNGNVPVKIPLKKAVHDAELFCEVTQMSIDLIELIRRESELKKHHRAYLHVQDELDRTANKSLARIDEILEEREDHDADDSCGDCPCCGCENCETCPVSPCSEEADAEESVDEGVVAMSKADFDQMVEDVLTLAELVDMVCHFRCEDLKLLDKYAKLLPDLASYEHGRIGIYKDASFEAEAVMDRWDNAELTVCGEAN